MEDDRTTEEILEELAGLRRRLAQMQGESTPGPAPPVRPAAVTRRDALTVWVAPVLVSLPIVQTACAPPRDAQPRSEAEPEVAPTMTVPTMAVPTMVVPTMVVPTASQS